jgi:hypothetical protein
VGCQAEAVESFASSGRFWLPQTPGRGVHGDLAIDDVGVELHVYESLRGPTALSSTTCGGPMQWATEPVVYGLLRTGEEVTLLGVSGLAVPVDVAEENWSARFAVRGGLVGGTLLSTIDADGGPYRPGREVVRIRHGRFPCRLRGFRPQAWSVPFQICTRQGGGGWRLGEVKARRSPTMREIMQVRLSGPGPGQARNCLRSDWADREAPRRRFGGVQDPWAA